jgi:hypothetical protein
MVEPSRLPSEGGYPYGQSSYSSQVLPKPNFLIFIMTRMVTIRLNPKLSPQKNAEQFYRKSKNQKKEIEIFESTL